MNNSWLTDYVKQTREDVVEKSKKAAKDATEEFLKLEEEKTKKIYYSVIDYFYNSYERKMYVPRETLYGEDFAEIRKKGKKVIINFHPEVFISRTGYNGENGLYTTVFLQGWHGGTNKYGGMKYPVGKFKDESPYYYNGEYKPYDDIRYKWVPAVQAPISPYDDFVNRFNKYQDTEFEEDVTRIINKHIDRIFD